MTAEVNVILDTEDEAFQPMLQSLKRAVASMLLIYYVLSEGDDE